MYTEAFYSSNPLPSYRFTAHTETQWDECSQKILAYVFLKGKSHSSFSDGAGTQVSKELVANCSYPTCVNVIQTCEFFYYYCLFCIIHGFQKREMVVYGEKYSSRRGPPSSLGYVTPSGYLKPRVVPNTTYTFFLTRTHLI